MIAEALAAACPDASVLARLGGPLGEVVRAKAAELARTPDRARATRAAWGAAARAPIPPGVRGVHPTWIESSLAGLPERARAAIAGAVLDRVDVWLARWACAALPPLPAADHTGPPHSIADVVRMPGEALTAWLASVGADQLALALAVAGPDAVAGAAIIVGESLYQAASRIARPPRDNALGPERAAIARCRVPLDERALVRIGARAIAPEVDALARWQLAVRLPRVLGVIVRDELAAHAATPRDQCPAWRALAAT